MIIVRHYRTIACGPTIGYCPGTRSSTLSLVNKCTIKPECNVKICKVLWIVNQFLAVNKKANGVCPSQMKVTARRQAALLALIPGVNN